MPLEPSPAVLRAVDVLEHLASRPRRAVSVAELAREVGIARATCHTVLLALADRGYVRRDDDLRYTLGPSCLVLGDAAQHADPAVDAAAEHAEALARSLDAFGVVSIRDGDDTRVVRVYDFGPPLSLRARIGEAMPLVPPFGAVYLAWADEDDVERWLARPDPPLTPAGAQHFRHALAAIRDQGFSVTLVTPRQPDLVDVLERLVEHREEEDARRERDVLVREMSHSEYLPGDLDPSALVRIAQVSAPVLSADGRAVASVMVLGPTHEVTAEEAAVLGRRVADAAARATADALGGSSVSER